MMRPPSQSSRPPCFGLGRDSGSGQFAPAHRCQACEHVTACALLRSARAVETIAAEFQERAWERAETKRARRPYAR